MSFASELRPAGSFCRRRQHPSLLPAACNPPLAASGNSLRARCRRGHPEGLSRGGGVGRHSGSVTAGTAGRGHGAACFAVATGVIGAGAAMLPTGAAAGASARILRSLPDQDDGANQGGTLNGQLGKTPVLSGTEASNGQAATSTQNGQ